MNILFINLGSGLGDGPSGGTIRMVSVAKGFYELGNQVSIMSTSGPLKFYRDFSNNIKILVIRCSILSTKERNNFDRLLSYIIVTINSFKEVFLNYKKFRNYELIYTSSDYICDVIPAIFIMMINKKVKWSAIIHHKCSKPSKRSGIYFFNLISYYGQLMTHKIIARFSTTVLCLDTDEGIQIEIEMQKKGSGKIHRVMNGLHAQMIYDAKLEVIIYDACFVGGFRASKGIYSLLEVWRNVVAVKPNAKLCLIGSGMPNIIKSIKLKINEYNLEKNITILENISNYAVYSNMKKSKIYITASQEEGWGISVYEALALGLDVVAYELPAYNRIKPLLTIISQGNAMEMSNAIINKINEIGIKDINHTNYEFVDEYDWTKISQYEYKLMV